MIKWLSSGKEEQVECSRCISSLVDLTEDEPTNPPTRQLQSSPSIVKTEQTTVEVTPTRTDTASESDESTSDDDDDEESDEEESDDDGDDDDILVCSKEEMPVEEEIAPPPFQRIVSVSTTTSEGVASVDTTLVMDGDEESDGNKASNLASSESNSEEDNQDFEAKTENTEESSTPPSWIRKGLVMDVVSGNKDEPYKATALSDPFHNGTSFVVRIKWAVQCTKQVVDCSKCRQSIDLTTEGGDGPRKKRQRRAAAATATALFNTERIHPDTHGQKRVKSLERKALAAREADANGMGRAFALSAYSIHSFSVGSNENEQLLLSDDDDGEKKKPAVDALENERELLRRSLSESMPSKKYSPELMETSLDAVGAPYSANAVMVNMRLGEEKTNAPWWDPPKNFKVEIGMKVRKIFESNKKPMIGTVVSKVDELVENKDLELVEAWMVDYGDDDPEELEEKELRRYRYPHPILPDSLGREFQCLELFGGRCISLL
jgi:hypothetical protein